jgi:phosphodiesterase/alkaline phosphatase D-like protein
MATFCPKFVRRDGILLSYASAFADNSSGSGMRRFTSMPHLIIGHTTDTAARLWVRGDRSSTTCEVTLRHLDQRKSISVALPSDSDFTATVEFHDLDCKVDYAVHAAFTPSGIRIRGRLRTVRAASAQPDSFSFVLSSCNLSIVSINNFLALLAATAGTSLADSSLDLPFDRWQAPPFRWLRWLFRPAAKLALRFTAGSIKWATGLKQSGSTYLRSPFLKLSAVFESCVIDIPAPPRPEPNADQAHRDRLFLAVADHVQSSWGATGVVASIAVVDAENIRRVVLTQVQGTFEKDAVLFRCVSTGRRESLHRLGAIKQVRAGRQWYEPPSFFIHAGDQIYYDFPEARRAPDRNEYRLAYREAWFEDDALRHVLAHWPHYMTLDDHEIADQFALDFHAPAAQFEPGEYLREATMAYRNYAGALNPSRPNSNPPPAAGPFWYTFNKGRTQFFVMDTRTQRRDKKEEVIDPAQMSALLCWMSEHKHKDDLKFVVTSVPFVAEINEVVSNKKDDWFKDTKRNSEQDKWSAERFKRQREEIIEHIAAERIEHLVFLTGDMHCCYHATMRIGFGNTNYESTIVHELAGGPVNQLQLARVNEFDRRRTARTGGDTPVDYEVALEHFHGDVSAVMHLKVEYLPRDQVTGETRAMVPEVEWNVIRTLTDPGPEGWLEDEPLKAASPGVPESPTHQTTGGTRSGTTAIRSGEPVMSGRISFAKRRRPEELLPW